MLIAALAFAGCGNPSAPDGGLSAEGGGTAGGVSGTGGGQPQGGGAEGGGPGGGTSSLGGGSPGGGGGAAPIPDAGDAGDAGEVADAGDAGEAPEGGVIDAGQRVDAGPADAGTSAGDGGFYGAVKCPNADTLVCDDFEASALDPQWSTVLSNGTLTLDATRAARGNSSLHTTVGSGGGTAMISLKTTVPLDGQRLWGRMFVYVPSSAQSSLTGHSNLVTAAGRNDLGANSVDAVMVGGGVIGSLFWQDSPGVDISALGLQTHVPLDRWFCVEWDFNGVARELNTYLDGQLVPMSKLSGYHPPLSATLDVGVQFSVAEAWFDSVAFSRTRIGCEN
jgi:hypothetical protein